MQILTYNSEISFTLFNKSTSIHSKKQLTTKLEDYPLYHLASNFRISMVSSKAARLSSVHQAIQDRHHLSILADVLDHDFLSVIYTSHNFLYLFDDL